MKKLFGTDGIRAVAGQYPLDYSAISILARGLVSLLQEKGLPSKILIGRDTRESGPWIEEALTQGICEAGGKCVSAGIIPTSAISFLTKKHAFSAGVVISASHNPYQDNGIKVFSAEGTKIPDEWESELEKFVLAQKARVERKNAEIALETSLAEDYKRFLERQIPDHVPVPPLKIVLDCSNGASSFFAPGVFSDLGFRVTAINDTPDGKNINRKCGSLHPEGLAKKVTAEKADLGIAFDGDGDRAIWVDEKGRILNGDHTLFIQSRFMKERGRLKSDTVVATTMSNMALEIALTKMGLRLFRTRVGDKYVLEQMIHHHSNLGGERSGHTIFIDDCLTGDGILTSLKMVEVMLAKQASLSALVEELVEFPQVLINVPVARKIDFSEFPEIIQTMDQIRFELQNSGRIDVRYSGTEPLARVMVEGQSVDQIERAARRMIEVIAKYLGN